MPTLIGQTLGQYQITERLGGGGMAEVYKATHTRLQTQVAIKVLHSHLVEEEDFLARFEREARAAAMLRHPNIIRVFDYDVQDGLYYIVREYVDGGTLKDRISTGEALTTTETLSIFRQAALAIDYAHQQGMIHRDIKPANILLDHHGHAFLTDFGIAHIISASHFTATGALIGTPMYMSPEQCMGHKVTTASDIYSLGMVLYEMVTGKVPFAEETPLSVIHKHVYESLPMPSQFMQEVDPRLEEVIMKALEREPAERYASAHEMLSALEEVLQASAQQRTAAVPSFQSEPEGKSPTESAMVEPAGQTSVSEPARGTADADLPPGYNVDSGATMLDQTPLDEYEAPPVVPIPTVFGDEGQEDASYKATYVEEVAPVSASEVSEAPAQKATEHDFAAKEEEKATEAHRRATVFSDEKPVSTPAPKAPQSKARKRKINPWIIVAAVVGVAAIVVILVLTQGGGSAAVACDYPEACLDRAAMYAEQGNPDMAYRNLQEMWGLLAGEEQPPSAWKWCRASEIMLSVQEYDAARDYANACILWTQDDPELQDLRVHGQNLIQIANEQQ